MLSFPNIKYYSLHIFKLYSYFPKVIAEDDIQIINSSIDIKCGY